MNSLKGHIALVCTLLTILSAQRSGAQSSPRSWSSADIQKSIDRLKVFGSVLYVAAHPDDENTAFLAAMVNGAGVRTGYVAITRGEGGQNLIGAEQGALLGMIRSQELLQARMIDGAEQFFTRAIDFGYSKTMNETLKFWGKENILGDLVYIIRSFRPDVIVTRFTSDRGGHGNHTSSALLALEAFEAASDPGRFPEQLESVEPWQPVRILWNGFRFRQSDPVESKEGVITIDLGEYDPVLGVSYSELAGRARSMHKSQGFGASQSRGEFLNTFEHLMGTPAREGIFDGIDLSWGRFPGGDRIQGDLESLSGSFSPSQPSSSIPRLFALRAAMKRLEEDPAIQRKIEQIEQLIVACAGVWVDAHTADRSYVRGDSITIRAEVVNRSQVSFRLDEWSVEKLSVEVKPDLDLRYNGSYTGTRTAVIGPAQKYSQPVWLEQPPTEFSYVLSDLRFIGLPESPPVYNISVVLRSPQGTLTVRRPVRYRTIDPVDGEVFAPLRIVPRMTASFEDRVMVFPGVGDRDVRLRLSAHGDIGQASISLSVPQGWNVDRSDVTMTGVSAGEERTASFRLTRTSDAASGTVSVKGTADGEEIRYSLAEATYDHIPPQTLLEQASAKLVAADIRTAGGTIGYIMGAGDEVPDGLRQIGYDVILLTDDDLLSADLSRFSSIIAGVRAYNTRPVLRIAAGRLHTYMEQGGVYLAQYMTTSRNVNTSVGPYPMTVGRDRVTDETASMRILNPDHALFHFPNEITPADFDGWVQERGLYFAETWDERYTPLFACNDPGEEEVRGSLLVTSVGRGAFVYTGLAFFRQIPAGVPGAYRILANIVSLGQARR